MIERTGFWDELRGLSSCRSLWCVLDTLNHLLRLDREWICNRYERSLVRRFKP